MNEAMVEVPLGEVWADEEFNARGYISPASALSLANDIEKEGQLQPIRLQRVPNKELGTLYKIVIGHRRFEAVKLLARRDPIKWGGIKAIMQENVLSDPDALIMNLKENLERVDLNMLQEAQGIHRFRGWGWDAKRVAEALGRSKRWVEVRWGLLRLPEEIQRRAAAGYINQYQVEQCIGLDKVEDQVEYVRKIIDHQQRGKKIPSEQSAEAKRTRRTLSIMVKGESRTLAEMALVQESIQDSFGDNKHPAAMALAWAQGIISYEEFVKNHVERWAEDEGKEFKHHEGLLKHVG